MSPPTKNGFVGSSSSSTGTRPRLNGTTSRSPSSRMNGGGGPSQATSNTRSLRQQSEQLEQLLIEQQAKLEQKNMTESLQDLKEKLELLQTFNNSDNEQFDFHPRSSHYDSGGQEFLNNLHRYNQRSFSPLDQLRSENSKLKLSLQQQQEHIHQLTQSLNQCFQAVLTIQRDVSRLQQTVSVITNQGEASQATNEDNLDSISQQRDFESHSWDFDFQPQPSSRPTASDAVSATLDPWNNFFSNQGGLIGGSESGVSTGNSGALNNTVLPGVRANNYWDNFRSFSRQNRLSTAVAANNVPSLTPVVAQVTPRQVPQLYLPHSPFRANLSMTDAAGTDHHQQLLDNAAMVEPFFSSISSPSRPRRKQKINREQNVSSSNSFNSRSRPEASVFPMPQQQIQPSLSEQQSQQPISQPISQVPQPQQNEVQPMVHQRQQVLNPVVTSIKRSIYTQVNELIAQNEERPEQLARIYHNLQNCMNSTEMMANLNQSSGSGANDRRPWGSMYQDVEEDDDDDNDENNVSSTSLFKNGISIKTFNAAVLAPSTNSATNDNRLALLAASSAAEVNSSGESSLVQEEDQHQHQLPLFAYEASSGIQDSLASLGAVGGTNSIEPVETIIKKQVNNEDTKQQNVVTVAVPKNIQRNIISRERDDRRKLRHRGGGEQKPRNMMCSNTTPSSTASAAPIPPPSTSAPNDMGFIPIKFRNDEQYEACSGGDQEFEPLEMEVGLDRVPTRLSSSELEAGRRQEDEENLQNLVDEVLNSTSSEVDFIVGNSDLS